MTDDRAHEFDFWIGEWDVHGPKGQQVGTSSITAMFGNGMLHEHWHGTGGVEGRSITGYDEERDRWHQTWMDSTGGVLLLDGGLRDGAMVLEAPGQRITWRHEGEEVRQVWESSTDEGAAWTVAFDGRYRRRPA